jgi:hypothetical protein
MRTAKISISFSFYSDVNLEAKASYIIASMKGNPSFTDPVPNIAELQAALKQFSADLLAAANLDRKKIANKNASRAVLEQLLTELGMYVMYVAKGNEATLTSSGFTLGKIPQPRYIDNPGNVTLSNGITSGQMVASVVAVKGNSGYVYEICAEQPTETNVWTSFAASRSKFTFTNLLPGKKYWIRVAATGFRGQIAYSPVASQFAQ